MIAIFADARRYWLYENEAAVIYQNRQSMPETTLRPEANVFTK